MAVFITILLFTIPAIICDDLSNGFCDKDNKYCSNNSKEDRYIFYDVNPPEGFNLRRDVYMRYAVFAHKLKKSYNSNINKFKLVLPPWTPLYHWKNAKRKTYFPWSTFFDVQSLKLFAPVLELHDLHNDLNNLYSEVNIEETYVLQHFKDMFETGNFEERMAIEDCQDKIKKSFFNNRLISSNVKCLSFHGHVSQLTEILEKSTSKTILFDHAEVPLHDIFGDALYWQARRSMRFNKALCEIAKEFRKKYLNSSDEADGIYVPPDWRDEKPKRSALGGPYLAVHFRRADFLWSRSDQLPSVKGAAKQIISLLKQLNLKQVFVATDASDEEVSELTHLITKSSYNLLRYRPTDDVMEEYGDGGVAIVDQIICSHGRYFIGTHESTFSFRIQEEREILGFPVKSTFNRLCGDEEKDCQKPSIWKIVY